MVKISKNGLISTKKSGLISFKNGLISDLYCRLLNNPSVLDDSPYQAEMSTINKIEDVNVENDIFDHRRSVSSFTYDPNEDDKPFIHDYNLDDHHDVIYNYNEASSLTNRRNSQMARTQPESVHANFNKFRKLMILLQVFFYVIGVNLGIGILGLPISSGNSGLVPLILSIIVVNVFQISSILSFFDLITYWKFLGMFFESFRSYFYLSQNHFNNPQSIQD